MQKMNFDEQILVLLLLKLITSGSINYEQNILEIKNLVENSDVSNRSITIVI